tara:strand:+ start:1929 stop:3305 length:1377 start_codon:yes stop_codon:yes gene_type:complete
MPSLMEVSVAEHLVGELVEQPLSISAGGTSLDSNSGDGNYDDSLDSAYTGKAEDIDKADAQLKPSATDTLQFSASLGEASMHATDDNNRDMIFAILSSLDRLHVKSDTQATQLAAQEKQLDAQATQLDAQATQLDQMRNLIQAQTIATPEFIEVSDSESDGPAVTNPTWQLSTPTFIVTKHVKGSGDKSTTQWNGHAGQPRKMLAEHISLWALGESEFDSSLFEFFFQHGSGSWFPHMHPIMNSKRTQYAANHRMMVTFQSPDMLKMMTNFGEGSNDPKGKGLLAFGLPDNLGPTMGEPALENRLKSIKSYLTDNILPAYGLLEKSVSFVFSVISTTKCDDQVFHTDGPSASGMCFINVLINVCSKNQGLDIMVDGSVQRAILRPGQMIVFRGDIVHRGLGWEGIRLHVCIVPRTYRFYSLDDDHAQSQAIWAQSAEQRRFTAVTLTKEAVTQLSGAK